MSNFTENKNQDLGIFFNSIQLGNTTLENYQIIMRNGDYSKDTYLSRKSNTPINPQSAYEYFVSKQQDIARYGISYLRSPDYYDLYTQENSHKEYKTDIAKLTKEQIVKRMSVLKNFLFYPKQTIEAILQYDTNLALYDFICIGNIVLYVNEAYCIEFNSTVCAGFWFENNNYSYEKQAFGFDIISLHTFLNKGKSKSKLYTHAVEELYDFFATRNFIKRNSDASEKEFYIQEKNPIAVNTPIFFDAFFNNFEVIDIVQLYNTHFRYIGIIIKIKTKTDEVVDLYYTFWRHIKSQIFKLFPLPPQASYDLYHKSFNTAVSSSSTYSRKEVVIHNDIIIYDFADDISLVKLKRGESKIDTTNLFYCGGINSLTQTNLEILQDKSLYIYKTAEFTYGTLTMLSRLCKENKIKDCFVLDTLQDNYQYKLFPLKSLLENPQEINLEKPTTVNLLSNPDDEIAGSNRKRFTIVDPIIESGTITWLFAKEKVGKTIFALSLAQAIGTGNRNIGTWHISEARKVLYIDGEMPADKLQQHINKIIKGQGGNPEIDKKAFSVYLFSETDYEYEDILDENWQERYLVELMGYDLIILDNYYSLYNSLNPIKLIRWMKKLTRKGVAFLILDHTNSEGELQGSIVKKRAMDLGIKLEMLESNELDISFHADRYGRENETDKFALIPCFTSSEFSYDTKLLNEHGLNSDLPDGNSTNPLSNENRENLELLIIYVLKKRGEKNTDIAKKLNKKDSYISKKLKKMNFNAELQEQNESEGAKNKQKYIVQLYEKHQADFEDEQKCKTKIEDIITLL